MYEFIPVNEPVLNGNEKKYLCECIDTGWISSEGPFIKRFEDDMCKLTGRKYGIAVSNGTAALEVAAAALELKSGDEVIMPTFTIISCAEAVVKRGAVPVLIDCDPITYNMDILQIESKITSKTKAIMVVHIYGLPVDMDPILEIAKKYNLKIIEDAAEMHGQTYKGKPCGSFGDISIFSFYPNKHITTGEGGMVLTDDEHLAERSKSLRNLCFKPERRYVHDEIGFNYRMTNMQAALGVAQIERINETVKKKREIGSYYNKLLKDIQYLNLPLLSTSYADNIYWVYGIILDNEFPIDAFEITKRLGEKKVGTRTFFWPMHEQPVFKNMGLYKNEKYPISEKLARRGFYIPSGLALNKNQMEQVAERLEEVVRECTR